jgi:hypothetical protein
MMQSQQEQLYVPLTIWQHLKFKQVLSTECAFGSRPKHKKLLEEQES